MSTETCLGQVAPLVVAVEAIPSRLPPCRGSGCWGPLWGPLTPRHGQKKPQLLRLAQEGFLFLWAVLPCVFSLGGLLIPPLVMASDLSVPLFRTPSCILSRVPTPLPGGTVMARVAPSGRGELCQFSVCSRLLCPYLVCVLSSFSVIMS